MLLVLMYKNQKLTDIKYTLNEDENIEKKEKIRLKYEKIE